MMTLPTTTTTADAALSVSTTPPPAPTTASTIADTVVTPTSVESLPLPAESTTPTGHHTGIGASTSSSVLSVAERLQIAFELPAAERFVSEHTCWLIKDVLLKGCLFLTANHLCFYASLPKEEGQLYKSGFLAKKSRKSKQFKSYWFELKDSVLTHYESAARHQYQPLGSIALKTVIDVQVSSKRPNVFKLVTSKKKYSLQAGSAQSMTDWRKTIEAAVFRARNRGEHGVRVVLPFANVTDVKLLHADNFADTIMIAVNEDAETDVDQQQQQLTDDKLPTSTDEYYFSYFLNARQLFEELRQLHRAYQADESQSAAASSLLSTSPPTTMEKRNSGNSSIESPTSVQVESNGNNSTSDRPSDWRLVDWLPNFRGGFKQAGSMKSRRTAEPQFEEPSLLKVAKVFPLLPDDCVVNAVYTCYLFTGVWPKLGRLEIVQSAGGGGNFLLFRSRLVGVKSKACLPFVDIVSARKQSGLFRFGMAVLMKDETELWFEFHTGDQRNKCLDSVTLLLSQIEPTDNQLHDLVSPPPPIVVNSDDSAADAAEAAFGGVLTDGNASLSITAEPHTNQRSASIHSFNHFRRPAVILNQLHRADKNFATAEFSEAQLFHLPPLVSAAGQEKDLIIRPPQPLIITCLTIGTRGDVQPFIALCKGLMAYGHTCRIATHGEYQSWVESHGIEFRNLSGNPADIMRLCVDNGMFSLSFILEAISSFKDWLEDLMKTAWEACQGTQVVIESPVSMAGFHIAEKLDVPYLATFTMPWTRTSQFPHPFAVPNVALGAGYNTMTWAMMEQVYWTGIQPIVNRFRKQVLNLPAAVGTFYDDHHVPFIYNFSPSVVEPPSDWKDNIHICGYWFLDRPDADWTPPADLQAFLEGAPEVRHLPIVYIGFGSIIVPDPDQLTATVLKAVQKAGVRAIVSKGWSGRRGSEVDNTPVAALNSDTVYFVSSVPHDWLFPRINAVVHHGGAGTTAAGLRAGLPTLIKPFFGDQYFWASRLNDLKVGTSIKKLDVDSLKNGLVKITKDDKMIERAKTLGEKIRREDGVGVAITCIHRTIQLYSPARQPVVLTSVRGSPPPQHIVSSTVPAFSSSMYSDSTELSISPRANSWTRLTAAPSKDGYESDSLVNYGGTPAQAIPKPNKLRRQKKGPAARPLKSLSDMDEILTSEAGNMLRNKELALDGPLQTSTSLGQIAAADVPGLTASSSLLNLDNDELSKKMAFSPPVARSRLPFQKHRQNQSDGAAFLQSVHRQRLAAADAAAAAGTGVSEAASNSTSSGTKRSIFGRFWNPK